MYLKLEPEMRPATATFFSRKELPASMPYIPGAIEIGQHSLGSGRAEYRLADTRIQISSE
jgi:hypothetical protein